MNDILFGNNNKAVIQKLAKRSLKAKKNTIAILAIMLATLLFTSLFTIAISLQTAMQESNMRTTGTSAHAGIKRLSWEEYEQLSSDAGIKDSGYSIIIGNAVGENFNKVPTELRYGDETYANLTFNDPDIGRLPEQKNEVATSRIVLAAMGLPDKVGTQMELTFMLQCQQPGEARQPGVLFSYSRLSYNGREIGLTRLLMDQPCPAAKQSAILPL